MIPCNRRACLFTYKCHVFLFPQAIGYESFFAQIYLCLSSVCAIAFIIKLIRCDTIAAYDNFEPRGKIGARPTQTSACCLKRSVHVAFEELIKNARFKYVILSYSNEGYLTCAIMSKYGRYEMISMPHKRFNPNDVRTQDKMKQNTLECLHVLSGKGLVICFYAFFTISSAETFI